MKPSILVTAVFTLVLGGAALLAAPKEAARGATASSPSTGNIAAGKVVAKQCFSCHNEDGISTTPMVPHIAGQHAEYIAKVLRNYRMGFRKGEVMKDHIGNLSGNDMINVAAYFASLKPFPEVMAERRKALIAGGKGKVPAIDPLAAAREESAPCAACHGEDGNSVVPGTPSLAGMHPTYLEQAIKEYKDGTRSNDVMKAFTEPLSQSEIENIATFYALAQPKKSAVEAPGDAARGAAAASTCVGCHGLDGNANDPTTPRLAGLDPEYFVAAVQAYKDGTRNHAVMKDLVSPLSADDVQNLAAFYASLTPKAPATLVSVTADEWAQKCDRCHGKDGLSTDPRFPILAGQSETYLLRALKLYHTERRKDPLMRAMAFPLRDADFRELAAYYASKGAEK